MPAGLTAQCDQCDVGQQQASRGRLVTGLTSSLRNLSKFHIFQIFGVSLLQLEGPDVLGPARPARPGLVVA